MRQLGQLNQPFLLLMFVVVDVCMTTNFVTRCLKYSISNLYLALCSDHTSFPHSSCGLANKQQLSFLGEVGMRNILDEYTAERILILSIYRHLSSHVLWDLYQNIKIPNFSFDCLLSAPDSNISYSVNVNQALPVHFVT